MAIQSRTVGHWADAVGRKPLGIQKCYGWTDRPTETARCRVACPRLKTRIAPGPHTGPTRLRAGGARSNEIVVALGHLSIHKSVPYPTDNMPLPTCKWLLIGLVSSLVSLRLQFPTFIWWCECLSAPYSAHTVCVSVCSF